MHNQEQSITSFEWIIFDADNTLFSFDSHKGLIEMFNRLNIKFTNKDISDYHNRNKELWNDLREKRISLKELGIKRFSILEQKTGYKAHELNHVFLESMADIGKPLPSAINILKKLSRQYKLALMTNGFRKLQDTRIKKYNLENIFHLIITSEEVKVAKPNLEIFEAFFNRSGYPSRDKVLIIGDEYAADIVGGQNAGIKTCWLNPKNSAPQGVGPTYNIKTLEDLDFL